MGKGNSLKNYLVISGFNIRDNNRGTAALSYGAVSFCAQKGYLNDGMELVNFVYVKKFWKQEYKNRSEEISSEGKTWRRHVLYVFELEKKLYDTFQILLPFTSFGKTVRKIKRVVAINGGDGFSDIYSTPTFLSRLTDTEIAMKENIPVIILPQTIGPFKERNNYDIAQRILTYAEAVYVRDDKFVRELAEMNVPFELTKDLSAFMQPEPFDIDIKSNAVGVNVSGLAYSNKFRTLAGQFDAYPELVDRIIRHFRDKGHVVYLIPHSYNYTHPETDNDDIVACKAAYDKLQDKKNVVFVDRDLTSPQIKYVISKMSFFIGTRMHANFAAIYTGVPLFGLAYSYKFEGAFNANGLDGKMQTAMINNIKYVDINRIVKKIKDVYEKLVIKNI